MKGSIFEEGVYSRGYFVCENLQLLLGLLPEEQAEERDEECECPEMIGSLGQTLLTLFAIPSRAFGHGGSVSGLSRPALIARLL